MAPYVGCDGALRRAEDGRALLGEGPESLCGIGRAHVLGDELELEREPLAQAHVEPAVDERLTVRLPEGLLSASAVAISFTSASRRPATARARP